MLCLQMNLKFPFAGLAPEQSSIDTSLYSAVELNVANVAAWQYPLIIRLETMAEKCDDKLHSFADRQAGVALVPWIQSQTTYVVLGESQPEAEDDSKVVRQRIWVQSQFYILQVRQPQYCPVFLGIFYVGAHLGAESGLHSAEAASSMLPGIFGDFLRGVAFGYRVSSTFYRGDSHNIARCFWGFSSWGRQPLLAMRYRVQFPLCWISNVFWLGFLGLSAGFLSHYRCFAAHRLPLQLL
jgi:hypothetical protein